MAVDSWGPLRSSRAMNTPNPVERSDPVRHALRGIVTIHTVVAGLALAMGIGLLGWGAVFLGQLILPSFLHLRIRSDADVVVLVVAAIVELFAIGATVFTIVLDIRFLRQLLRTPGNQAEGEGDGEGDGANIDVPTADRRSTADP